MENEGLIAEINLLPLIKIKIKSKRLSPYNRSNKKNTVRSIIET